MVVHKIAMQYDDTMTGVEHFLSELHRLEQQKGSFTEKNLRWVYEQCAALLKSTFGSVVVDELFSYWKDTYGVREPPQWLMLGYLTAFLCREYEESTMPLSVQDFEEIRLTLDSAADEIDIGVLTELYNFFVEKGYF
ncbi:hypothetical protein [Treponema sp. J25]|uniref:hypothetical protein n=1 Tax=Treponema sp. J25 TaxID=2094121 RepID=UPI001044FBA8|nr:hypothetical protein [Treponema sp. J25]MCX7656514.1 hypothetical protein [Treponemataceae bacterium]